MFGTSNKQQNDKSHVKFGENSASCQHIKYLHVDIQKLSADLQFPDSENTTLKCHNTLPSDDHVKRLSSVKRSLQYDEHHAESKIRKCSDVTLEQKHIDLIQTNFEHEESVFNIESHIIYSDACNSTYDKTKTFVNTVQMNNNIETDNASDSNYISKNYGFICTCCHGNTFQRCKCMIFLQHNYNFLIPSVVKALSRRCKATKSKEFICKKCHSSLKMGNTPVVSLQKCGEPSLVHDNDVIVDGGGEKNVKGYVKNEQVPIDLTQDP